MSSNNTSFLLTRIHVLLKVDFTGRQIFPKETGSFLESFQAQANDGGQFHCVFLEVDTIPFLSCTLYCYSE